MTRSRLPLIVWSPARHRALSRAFCVGLGTLLAACSADTGSSSTTQGSRSAPAGSTPEQAAPGSSAASPGGRSTSPVIRAGAAGTAANTTPIAAADSCQAISAQAENRRAPADIIIAVDNSGSMDEEIAFVRAQLNAFSEQITASGVDVRIILISAAYTPPGMPAPSGDDEDDESDESEEEDDNGICIDAPLGSGSCPADTRAPRYTHIAREVGSHDALDLIIETFPEWQSQLRPDASKTFVVVTDDNADGTAAEFKQSVAGLPGNFFTQWSFSGIFCQRECPEAAEVGSVYQQLVNETQGVAGELCDQNFAPVFDALAKSVIQGSGLACTWRIPSAPAGQTFDRSKVNVRYAVGGGAAQSLLQVPNMSTCADRLGWYYDDALAPQQILVCPTACSMLQNDVQARFEVLFGCETQLAPQ